MIDLDPLVLLAWEGEPAALVDALNRMQAHIAATEHRPLVVADLPESAQEFFTKIYSVSRKPGRPTKANARLLAVRRAYDRAAARWAFDHKRALIVIYRRTKAKEDFGDGMPSPMQCGDRPADATLGEMANESGLEEEALRDLIYPDRRRAK